MNPIIHQHIRELASMSSAARDIADRLGVSLSDTNPIELENLKKQLARMNMQIAYLEGELHDTEDDNSDMTDVEISMFMESFKKMIAETKIVELARSYNRAALLEFGSKLSYLMAVELVNLATSKKQLVPADWNLLVLRQGL